MILEIFRRQFCRRVPGFRSPCLSAQFVMPRTKKAKPRRVDMKFLSRLFELIDVPLILRIMLTIFFSFSEVTPQRLDDLPEIYPSIKITNHSSNCLVYYNKLT